MTFNHTQMTRKIRKKSSKWFFQAFHQMAATDHQFKMDLKKM